MSLPIVGQSSRPQPLSPEDVHQRLLAAFPDAQIKVVDLTGTLDHYQVEIISGAFQGLSLIRQHKLVYSALAKEMEGPIHALTLRTKATQA